MRLGRRQLKRRTTRLALLLVTMVVLSVFYTNCSRDKLIPLSASNIGVYSYGAVKADFCTSAPSPARQNVKYLFILDHSALNQPGIPLFTGDTTNADSDGSRRYGPLVNFVQNLKPSPTLETSFDIIDFADSAQQATGLNTFVSNKSSFISVATQDWIGNGTSNNPAPRDSGFTNYQSALNTAYTVIQNDLRQAALVPTANIIANSYQIIFVSGGVPVVPATVGPAGSLYVQDFNADLQPTILQMMALKTDATLGGYVGNITLNTAYYYGNGSSQDPAAISVLQKMAAAGNGQFVNFGGGEQILYQQFAPPVVNLQNQLADVLVENQNAVGWDNGQFMLDSDGDGLPDLIEIQLGSDPYKADTDGNGVSDLVEYRTKGAPCATSSCTPSARDPYSVCAGFSPTTDSSGNVTFKSTSGDGLNDCEKYVLGGNYRVFNSSGSLIPDFMALKNNIPIQPGDAAVAMKDPFGDGMTNYYKLKVGLPVSVSTQNLTDFFPRSTSLTVTSNPTPDIVCYHLDVSSVALSMPHNKIRVSVVQNKSVGQDEPTLVTAEGAVDDRLTLTLQPGDFR